MVEGWTLSLEIAIGGSHSSNQVQVSILDSSLSCIFRLWWVCGGFYIFVFACGFYSFMVDFCIASSFVVDLRWILQLYGLFCIVLLLSKVGRVILYQFSGPLVFPVVYSFFSCGPLFN